MNRPLYLHIGTSKSGTSSLQQGIYDSRDELLGQGVGLPLETRDNVATDLFRPLAAIGAGNRPQMRRQVEETAGRIRATRGDRLLVSLEPLAKLPRSSVRALLELLPDLDVHVVITARDWAKQIPSQWQQDVKARLTTPYADYIEAIRDDRDAGTEFRLRQDLVGITDRWGSSLPTDHVHVIATPSFKRDPDGLFRMFSDLVGFDPTTLKTPKHLRNTSLGYEQAEMLRRVNVALGSELGDVRREYKPVVKAILGDGALRKQSGTSLGLPPEHGDWVAKQCEEQLAELQRRGYDFRGEPNDLLVDRATLRAIPEMDDTVLAEVAIQALADASVILHRRAAARGLDGYRAKARGRGTGNRAKGAGNRAKKAAEAPAAKPRGFGLRRNRKDR